MDPITTAIISTSGASFLNFVATKIYNRTSGSSKTFFWKDRQENLSSLRIAVDFEELRKRIRIVVIDDENGFPIKIFQSEGYAIDKWDRVTDVTYGKLESGFYDIIVLDIKGVATDISNDDGFGVLESLKKTNPAQIIIAYSQHSYDFSKKQFFELADETITKPSDFLKIKGTIDNLIHTKYKPRRYIETLHALLGTAGIDRNEVRKFDGEIIRSIKKKEKPNAAKLLSYLNTGTELAKPAMTLVNTILKFFQ